MRAVGWGATLLVVGFAVLAVWLARDVPGAATTEDADDAAGQRPSPVAARVEVEPGDGASDIARALFDAGVIDSPRRFETLVSLFGYEGSLAAGVYDFEAGLTTTEIIERIRRGITAPLLVTIPEGLRLEEIAERLAQAGVVTASEFLAATTRVANWAGTLAALRPGGTPLDGYLFPSTYRFSARASADEVVRTMLERFDAQFTTELLSAINQRGRTVHSVLTMASIVEREAVVASERADIAAVFWNRLAAQIPLQADPTVQYALAEDPLSVQEFGYWKADLTVDDLAVESPYNTYAVAGLPPTPIASPGLAAIEAAVFPADTDFLYFVATGDGSHVFAETFEEHLENVIRYRDGEQ